MFDPSPKTVAFASAIASSASRTRNSCATGPKISSWYMRIVGRDVGDDGRRIEPARADRAACPPHSTRAPCATASADVLLDVEQALLVGERTDVGLLVHRIADAQRLHARDEQLLERVGDVVVHDEPLGRDAALPVVLHARRHRGLRGLLEVGRRHDHERVAAAELEHDRLELLARDACRSNARRACCR